MVEIIMIIEVLVTMAVIIIVKIMTYGRNSMENEKRRTWMEQKTGQVNTHKNIFHYKTSQALNGNVKNYYQKKDLKTMGHITPINDHYPRNG